MNPSYRLHSTSMVPLSPIILVYFAAHVPPLFVVIRYPVCKTAGVFSVDIRYLCGYNTRNKYTAAYVSQTCHRRFFCGALPPAFNCSFHKFLCIVVLYHSLSFLVQPLKHSKRLCEKSVGSSGMFGFVTSQLSSLARSVVFSFYIVLRPAMHTAVCAYCSFRRDAVCMPTVYRPRLLLPIMVCLVAHPLCETYAFPLGDDAIFWLFKRTLVFLCAAGPYLGRLYPCPMKKRQDVLSILLYIPVGKKYVNGTRVGVIRKILMCFFMV